MTHSWEVLNSFFLLSFFSLAQQPNSGQGRLIIDVSRPYTMTRHSRLARRRETST